MKKKVITALVCVSMLAQTGAFAMTTREFDNGMAKGISYFNQGLYYEAKDEFTWFKEYNYSKMNSGQQKYLDDYLNGTWNRIKQWENYVKNKIDRYNYYELENNSIAYDFNGDGKKDSLNTNVYANYYAYHSLIINNKKFLFNKVRHGQYLRLCVTDIDKNDNYLDIVLIFRYKAVWAEIFRYDGKNLLESKDFYTISKERSVEDERLDDIKITTGNGQIKFNFGSEEYNHKVGAFEVVDSSVFEEEF